MYIHIYIYIYVYNSVTFAEVQLLVRSGFSSSREATLHSAGAPGLYISLSLYIYIYIYICCIYHYYY